ncbi:MAG TPA: hypothetical protein VGT44_01250 [Ktedonobacteraceae bacterium]|nr:hypothetical protein [Ktedonobacteraceae bacterium]
MAIHFARRLITVSGAMLGAYIFFVRPWQRRWGATDEEVQRALPGDELLPHPDVKLTRAITIRAKPTDIWPWLVQIGQGRGGYYSYDWLENLAGLKMKSAAGINPAWQQLKVGDIIPAEPGGKGFKVLAIEPARALVIGSIEMVDEGVFEGFKQMFPAFTWAFILEEIDSEHTRLISRFCGQNEPSQAATLLNKSLGFIFEPAEFLMTRKMLLGIKQRAEQIGVPAIEPVTTEPKEKPHKNGKVASATHI